MNESRSTIVSLDALKGTCDPLLDFWASRALTHSLRAKRLWLISAPSCCLSLLLDWQSWALSLPAKSTSRSLPGVFIPSSWILIWQTAWLLLDVSLALVAWVVLTLLPNCISYRISSSDWTNCSFSPCICTFLFLSSSNFRHSWLLRRSYILPPYISYIDTVTVKFLFSS